MDSKSQEFDFMVINVIFSGTILWFAHYLFIMRVFFYGRKKHEHVSDSRSLRNMVLGIKKNNLLFGTGRTE